MLTTGYQLAAARALIGMDQVELATRVGVSANTIRNMEASKTSPIAGRSQNVYAVQRTLEAAGIEFLNHGQPGVRLRKAKQAIIDDGNSPGHIEDPDEADRMRGGRP